MKIFITGGAGFIGSALTESFLSEGHEVTVFDNFSNSSKDSLSHLMKNKLKIIEGDITKYSDLIKSVKRYDVVVHLAAKTKVDESILKPKVTHEVNVTGTVNLLKACVENKVNNVIAASSAAVFGKPARLPLTENSVPDPLSPYGESKLAMENHLKAYSDSDDINSMILRLFNVYGVGQSSSYAGVITKFVDNVSCNKPLDIFGDGTTTRDFVSLYDVVSSFHKAVKKIENSRGKIYHIASGKHVSIKELAELVISLSGKKLMIHHHPSKIGDIDHSQTSISLAKNELGYFPKIQLRDGIKKMLEATVK